MTTPTVSSAMLYAALCARYEAPEYCVEKEITLAGRRIDAVAFRLWGDNLLLGFEIKVSRSDWQRELKKLEKSRDWARAVDQFYLVAPAGVVLDTELPVGWGLIEWRESGLRLKAQPHPATPTPHVSREVAGRLISRQQERRRSDEFQERHRMREELRAEVQKQCDAQVERELTMLRHELTQSTQLLEQLHATAGIAPRDWHRDQKLRDFARTLSYLQAQSEPAIVVDRFVKMARDSAARANEIVAMVEKFAAESSREAASAP